MGWEALEQWGDAALVEQLAGGMANDVRSLRIDGRLAVGRLGWDEAHVDVPDLDLVLPGNAADLEEGARSEPG